MELARATYRSFLSGGLSELESRLGFEFDVYRRTGIGRGKLRLGSVRPELTNFGLQ
jgi:hypothetical protein